MVEPQKLSTAQPCYHAPEHARRGFILDRGSTIMFACDKRRFLANDKGLLLDCGGTLVLAGDNVLAFDSAGRVGLDSPLILKDESGLIVNY
jgi:hypothetical protein